MKMSNPRLTICLMLVVLVTACAGGQQPGQLTTQTPSHPGATPLASALPGSTPLPSHTPTPSPPRLPKTEQVVFTIPNRQEFSGKEGDPRPDWLGWGAQTFAAAPDGSFWIADSAIYPGRLLHFSPQGDLLAVLSLEDVVVYPYHLLAGTETLWILDISSQPPKVVQLDDQGQVLRLEDIPDEWLLVQGEPLYNAVSSLFFGETGELLVNTGNGLFELLEAAPPGRDVAGKRSARRLEALSMAGHSYRLTPNPADYTLNLEVDGKAVAIAPPDELAVDPLIGVYPDGSFAVTVYRQLPPQAGGVQMEKLVQVYSPAGDLLGVARLRPSFIYVEYQHDLAFGPGGEVYQLVSNADHSVEIVRLGFAPEYAALPPAPELVEMPAPPPATPRAPLWETPPASSSAAEIARETLVAFFTYLSQGRYVQAAPLFGGSLEELGVEIQPGESAAATWERACTQLLTCLPVAEITEEQQVSEDEYLFYVVFASPEGVRFELGACCGASPAEQPPVWQFAYPVKRIEADCPGGACQVWQVMRPPLYVP